MNTWNLLHQPRMNLATDLGIAVVKGVAGVLTTKWQCFERLLTGLHVPVWKLGRVGTAGFQAGAASAQALHLRTMLPRGRRQAEHRPKLSGVEKRPKRLERPQVERLQRATLLDDVQAPVNLLIRKLDVEALAEKQRNLEIVIGGTGGTEGVQGTCSRVRTRRHGAGTNEDRLVAQRPESEEAVDFVVPDGEVLERIIDRIVHSVDDGVETEVSGQVRKGVLNALGDVDAVHVDELAARSPHGVHDLLLLELRQSGICQRGALRTVRRSRVRARKGPVALRGRAAAPLALAGILAAPLDLAAILALTMRQQGRKLCLQEGGQEGLVLLRGLLAQRGLAHRGPLADLQQELVLRPAAVAIGRARSRGGGSAARPHLERKEGETLSNSSGHGRRVRHDVLSPTVGQRPNALEPKRP
mmetsp:Transcript_35823/g.108263  ORF Transcript_35823/g.108263 Transcript_35823/m.108263 type:complete len:414 (+) Transcript_35823:241-1482(+)